jgi:hypothetical protein
VHTDERRLAESVARGLVRCVDACANVRGRPLAGLRIAVQGVGSIGARAAHAFSEAWRRTEEAGGRRRPATVESLPLAARWAEGKAEGETSGVVKGKGEAIFAILATRGIAVDQEARARIEACRDAAMIDRWLVRAVTAASAGEIFVDPG